VRGDCKSLLAWGNKDRLLPKLILSRSTTSGNVTRAVENSCRGGCTFGRLNKSSALVTLPEVVDRDRMSLGRSRSLFPHASKRLTVSAHPRVPEISTGKNSTVALGAGFLS